MRPLPLLGQGEVHVTDGHRCCATAQAGTACAVARPQTAASPAGLTSRETGVLTLLAAWLSNTEIAARLVLSGRTIDNHVAAIFRKLGVSDRTEAREAAQQRGLV